MSALREAMDLVMSWSMQASRSSRLLSWWRDETLVTYYLIWLHQTVPCRVVSFVWRVVGRAATILACLPAHWKRLCVSSCGPLSCEEATLGKLWSTWWCVPSQWMPATGRAMIELKYAVLTENSTQPGCFLTLQLLLGVYQYIHMHWQIYLYKQTVHTHTDVYK